MKVSDCIYSEIKEDCGHNCDGINHHYSLLEIQALRKDSELLDGLIEMMQYEGMWANPRNICPEEFRSAVEAAFRKYKESHE